VAIDHCKQIIESKEREWSQISSNPEVAKYLSLAEGVRKSTIKLTSANEVNWNRMKARFAKVDGALSRLKLERQDQQKREQVLQQEKANLIEGREKTGHGIGCKITAVIGETLVRKMLGSTGIAALQNIKTNEIRARLREAGRIEDRIYFNDEGSLDWTYQVPEIEVLSE